MKTKPLTMEQKWKELRQGLWALKWKEVEQIGLRCGFKHWDEATRNVNWLEGRAVACLFGPRGGRYIVIRVQNLLFRVQENHIKWM